MTARSDLLAFYRHSHDRIVTLRGYGDPVAAWLRDVIHQLEEARNV